MTSNVYILVLNRSLAVITYRTNLQCSFTTGFAVNNIVKAASVAKFREAIHFLVNPYYQALVYLMIMTCNPCGYHISIYHRMHAETSSSKGSLIFIAST